VWARRVALEQYADPASPIDDGHRRGAAAFFERGLRDGERHFQRYVALHQHLGINENRNERDCGGRD
jgi:hypothetical protein